jgi:16S rRNA C967 or C1407 C5-methylase (RsmB/RsmF family)
VTNHEAQQFPLLRNLVPGSTEKYVMFDRILCDVPCSGARALQ